MVRSSFLRYIPNLVHGGLEGEVPTLFPAFTDALSGGVNSSTIMASLGTKEASRRAEKVIGDKGAGGTLVQTSAVLCVSYLFQRNDGKAVSEDK